MRRLPFLNGARAFESAARSGSFAAAAKELNVTAAAVSRMVRLLEERLGIALFQRHANGLTLTPAGRAYQGGLTQISDPLANLTNPGEGAGESLCADSRRRPNIRGPLADSPPRVI